MNDEYVRSNRMKAWRLALAAVSVTQVLIIASAFFTAQISGLLAAELSIFVAVVSTIGGFLYYNRD